MNSAMRNAFGSSSRVCARSSRLEGISSTVSDRRKKPAAPTQDESRLVTDGGSAELSTQQQLIFGFVTDRTAPEPDGDQDATSNLWTGKQHLKADTHHTDELERDDVGSVIEELVADGSLVYWHGLVAPATDEHLRAIMENEGLADVSRSALVALCNRLLQGETVTATVDRSDEEIVTDGGVPESFDRLARKECRACGDFVAVRYLVDGECVGCRERAQPDLATAGSGVSR
ncbi:hypothetical protein [Halobaculum sp. P14]|uniref:hypothetical protein n=1 Tax=Halobaculum sp. P14 TaxID=3421638 RepID=UPI003EBCA503